MAGIGPSMCESVSIVLVPSANLANIPVGVMRFCTARIAVWGVPAKMILFAIESIFFWVCSGVSYFSSTSSRMMKSGRWSPIFLPRTATSKPSASTVKPDSHMSRFLLQAWALPYLSTFRFAIVGKYSWTFSAMSRSEMESTWSSADDWVLETYHTYFLLRMIPRYEVTTSAEVDLAAPRPQMLMRSCVGVSGMISDAHWYVLLWKGAISFVNMVGHKVFMVVSHPAS